MSFWAHPGWTLSHRKFRLLDTSCHLRLYGILFHLQSAIGRNRQLHFTLIILPLSTYILYMILLITYKIIEETIFSLYTNNNMKHFYNYLQIGHWWLFEIKLQWTPSVKTIFILLMFYFKNIRYTRDDGIFIINILFKANTGKKLIGFFFE